MTAESRSFRWMETLLELLFERYDSDVATALLRDAERRAAAVRALTPELEAAGAAPELLESAQGENLFMAVLALRLKFPREVALEKARLNIAMREGRA